MATVNEKLTVIADSIRDKTSGTEPLTLDDMANGIDEVYEAGKKAEWDEFWDEFQRNGTRTNYQYAFYNFRNKCFKPKYDLVPTNANFMFYNLFSGGTSTSLKVVLENLGIKLDTSKCTNFAYMFYYSWITETGVIDTTGSNTVERVIFYATQMRTVEKLILKSDGSQTLTNPFAGSTALKNIVIEGTIGSNCAVGESPNLTKESITSFINALSSTKSGLTITFSQTAVNNAFTDDEWNTLIATKPNWTISLV